MPKVNFILPDGATETVDVAAGTSIMRAAMDNGVSGIVAECGGCLSCATCHAYIGETWLDKLPAASDEEKVMVECAIDVRENSRLTCQVVVTDELDGIDVTIPQSQY
jgi:2Fe-2S ferredoxin